MTMSYIATVVYRGPNVYSRAPVIRYSLGLPPASVLPREFDPGFVADLLGYLPGLHDHRDPCDTPGVLQRGVRDGKRAPVHRLFEHVCIELQNLTGIDLGCVRARADGMIGDDEAVVPYEDEQVGLRAGELTLELLRPLLGSGGAPVESRAAPFDFRQRLKEFLRFAERQRLPVQDRALVAAAEARGIPVTRLAGRLLQLGHGRHQQRVSGTQTSRTNIVGNHLAANKDYTRRVFLALGIPTPQYERVYRLRDAVAAAGRIGYPVVVKPNNGNMGVGVSVGMRDEREVRDAYRRARKVGRSVIVERFVPGADYRMLVIGGQLRAAAKRVPAHVVGDGEHTVEELVDAVNADPRRGAGQRSSWTRLELDEQSDRLLRELGYERTSVAADGEVVYLRRNANTSDGGTAVDVTDDVHPDNRALAERAAQAIGLDVAGVDFLVEDIARPVGEQGGVVCEINSRPGIRKHLWPAVGESRDVLGPIIESLFPAGATARVPIAAVTGSGDRTATARLLAYLLAGTGSTVGLATRDGVFISGRRIGPGGLPGPTAVPMVLLDPAVDVAVIEVDPADVAEHGLGYDWSDLCAVVDDDGNDGRAAGGAALRVVVAAARRAVVLAANDKASRALAADAGAEPWLVSAHDPDLPAAAGQRNVALESGADGVSVCLRNGGRLAARMPVPERPGWTDGDALEGAHGARYAAALALALGRRPDDIQHGLRDFPPGYCGADTVTAGDVNAGSPAAAGDYPGNGGVEPRYVPDESAGGAAASAS